jgi:hypothetical protein
MVYSVSRILLRLIESQWDLVEKNHHKRQYGAHQKENEVPLHQTKPLNGVNTCQVLKSSILNIDVSTINKILATIQSI